MKGEVDLGIGLDLVVRKLFKGLHVVFEKGQIIIGQFFKDLLNDADLENFSVFKNLKDIFLVKPESLESRLLIEK